MKKKFIVLIAFVFGILIIACSKNSNTNAEDIKSSQTKKQNNIMDEDNGTSQKVSVWTTYWDTETVLAEMNQISQNIENICFFAAYFNENEELFIPQETTDTYSSVKSMNTSNQYKNYLTIVNDIDNGDGTSSLKDTALLYDLLATKQLRSNHINDILTLAADSGYDGVEIDYEAIKKDYKLWKLFIKFIKELQTEATKRNLSVRVLLEPNAPVDKYTFPNGPEYVMMCYNLYGYGTKPGPKANPSFIQKMIKKMNHIKNKNSKLSFAFATGGFDFGKDGSINQLTESQAVELLNSNQATTKRDKKSQCLVFKYIVDNVTHEVWYADNTTIQSWIAVINKAGNYGISIWRLGGNLTLQP